MKLIFRITCIGLLFFSSAWTSTGAFAADRFIDFGQGDIHLNDGNKVNIFVAEGTPRGVLNAANNLCEDIKKVCGAHTSIVTTQEDANIVVQTVSDGRWEAYDLEVANGKIIITGSDRRGAIYGLYEISRQIGVSPWYWWADAPIAHHRDVYVRNGHYTDGEPKVKYRGIFINDESPSFTGWAKNKFGGVNSKLYSHVFELLLRLKANFLWPAMWDNAFNEDDPRSPMLADSMGIVMGTSHHEPMMRSHKEYTKRREQIGPWDYINNRENIDNFFLKGLERNKAYDQVVTIGMRGDGDTPMGMGNDDENIATLKDVISSQRNIISKVYNLDPSDVPQLWAIFTEAQRYYDRGLTVPNDVIKLFCDNNWGYIRRTGPAQEIKSHNPMGLYYHIDMNGGPWNNRWINCEPVPKLREQLNLAFRTGLDDLWIINVGDLKPKELAIDFIMQYAWNPDLIGPDDVKSYTLNWANSIFGSKHAEAIASIVSRYTKYNGMRHPETQDSKIFSVMNYQEADRMIAKWDVLVHDADSVRTLLPREAQDAYYQQVYYPTVASAGAAEIYLYAGKNQVYAAQGRPSANVYGTKVAQLYKRDKELQEYYNTSMSSGKWNGMMQDGHFGYTNWAMPRRDSIPAVCQVTPLGKAALGIVLEGNDDLPTFDNMDCQSYYIDLFNRGIGKLSCKVKSRNKWIVLKKGEVSAAKFGLEQDEVRLNVSIDWTKLSNGSHTGEVIIKANGERKIVKVRALKGNLPQTNQPYFGNMTGREYSIPATAYIKNESSSEVRWRELPDLGRDDGDMGLWPVTASSAHDEQTPFMDYQVYVDKAGQIPMLIGVIPTQDVNPERGLRIAIAIDNSELVVLDARQGMLDTFNEYTSSNLKKSPVLDALPKADKSMKLIVGNNFCRNGLYDAVRWLSAKLSVKSVGLHHLRVYMVDPEVVLERIIVNPDNKHPSYMGAPESMKNATGNY